MSADSPGRKGRNPGKKSFLEKYREALEREREKREMEREKRLKALEGGKGGADAVEDETGALETVEAPRKKTKEEKQAEHLVRIYRTLSASLLGVGTGVVSYLLVEPGRVAGVQAYTVLAFLVMVTGIVLQKHLFILLKLGVEKMGAKDWFYQGFMTFAFWFIAWTILLTQGT